MSKEETIDKRAKEIVERMSLRERLSMLDGDLPLASGLWRLVFGDLYHKQPFPAGRSERFGLPGLRFVDGPRGVVLEGGATTFPVAMARAASFDTALEERIGEAIALELRSFSGNLFGGVCVNLLRHPAWGRAQECYGEDPLLAGKMGAAAVRGVQRHALACVKHFAGNSIENARFSIDVVMTKRVLHELFLPQFKACVDAGAAAVMTAYNSLNGDYCGENKVLIREILKGRWGFKGLVLSDFVFGLRDAKKAIEAGLDLEMPFQFLYHAGLRHLFKDGGLDRELLNNAAYRVVRQQLSIPEGSYPPSLRSCPAHRKLAREAAAAAMVLVRNQDQTLPVQAQQTVAMFGALAARPNLGDRGSSDGRPERVVTLLEGARKALGSRLRYCESRRPDTVAEMARQADVAVVVVGYTHRDEGESILPSVPDEFLGMMRAPLAVRKLLGGLRADRWWRRGARVLVRGGLAATRAMLTRGSQSFGLGGDRRSLTISKSQQELVERVAANNPRTVVVVMAGSAVVMDPWDKKVASVLYAFYPGMEGGDAFADVLTGKSEPAGRLPFVIPQDAGQLPPFDAEAKQTEYDLFHGYRYLHHRGYEAAYPFGFGIGYTRFAIADLVFDPRAPSQTGELELSVRLQNTGDRSGSEVVQLYVGAIRSKVARPEKELKAFQKVWLDAGEEACVRFRIDLSELAYFDEESDRFVVEPTDYSVQVGRHADDRGALRACFSLPASPGVKS